MGSLREGIEKALFQTQPSTKVLAVAAKFGLQPPISLLRVAALLKPETVDWHTGTISSGDDKLVTANLHLQLESTGSWRFSGVVKDGGDGANFALEMGPKVVDQQGTVWFVSEANELDDDETQSFSKEGRNLWIARNWDAIRTKGFQWHIHADATAGVGEVIAVVLSLGIAALFISGASQCTEQEGWETKKHPDGSTTATCHFK